LQPAVGGRSGLPVTNRQHRCALVFTLTELLATLAVLSILAGIALPLAAKVKSNAKLKVCLANVNQINRAVLQFAQDHEQTLPKMEGRPAPGGWWWYKEDVKGYAGLKGASSPNDKVFACPDDRGYGEGTEKPLPFCRSGRHDYTSYVFNGVNLPGIPSVAGREISSIKEPSRTLL
jgi:prepilin-type N-terminal cleavage/methylation domain-containing protein